MNILFFQAAMPDGLDLIPALIDAAQGGRWSLVVSLSIMALVWLVTKAPLIKDLIQGEAKVWVAAIAGILGAVAVHAFASDGDWLGAILGGLGNGLAATGLWEVIRRKIDGKPVDADGDGVLDPLAEAAPVVEPAVEEDDAV